MSAGRGERGARTAAWLLAALACLACLGAVAAVEDAGGAGGGTRADSPPAVLDQDLTAWLRATQLQGWLGEPVALSQALCMQQRLAARWPADPRGPVDDRDRDRLRLAQERCAAEAPAENEPDRRLVTSARAALQDQVTRLLGLQARIRACRDRQGPPPAKGASPGTPGTDSDGALGHCVAQALGRPVAEPELRALLAAVSR